MKFTYDENTFSDLHKDAIGFRPRGHEFYDDATTPERKQEIWDYYCRVLEEELAWEKKRQAESIVKFEELVKTVIASGAGDRETAIKWLEDAEDDPYMGLDHGYFNYLYDLPYSYDYKKGEFTKYQDFYCEAA
jgi:hypothetical protein